MTDKRDITPAEDSIPLRVVVFTMTLTCIVSSCIFIKTAWPVWVLTLALAAIGSVVSYQYRNDKQSWMQWVVVVGVLAVGANAGSEFMDPSNGTMEFWGPLVHFIAGIFALHTFDLKTRSDINLSAMLGALILCFLSPVARSFYFGFAVFSYISLGTVMLYFDCMSRSLHNWLTKPMQPAPIVDVANTSGRRKPRGNVYLTVALLPLLSALGFLLVPRMDNFVDNFLSAMKHMDATSVLRFMPNIAPKALDIPHNEFESPVKKRIEMNRKKRELENRDEVDQEMQKMGIEKRKEVKAKEDQKVEKEKGEKKAEKKSEKNPEKKQSKKHGGKKSSRKSPPNQPPKNPNSPPTERPKTDRPKDNLFIGDKLDLDTDAPDSEVLLYRTTATRLFYSRHSVYDEFDGRFWKRSKAKLKIDEVEVKDKNAIPDKKPTDAAPGTTGNDTGADPNKSAEEEADVELHQEKLAEQAKTETGFGADMRVNYVYNNPPKGDYRLSEAAALHVPPKLPGIDLKQNFEVQNNVDNHLPNAWVPQNMHYTGNKVTVDDYGQILAPGNIKKGTKFSVSSQWPVYNVNGMRVEKGISADREKEIRERLENYLQIPEDLDADVLDEADQMAGKTGNWFAIAERLCNGIKAGHTLEQDRVGYEPADDRTKDFLIDTKAGTHKDFTSAFVILCRCEGLPARFVYGFTPGSFNKELGVQDVRMNDAQSWAEVFIPDYGWVPFDATPNGVMPGVKREEPNSLWALFKWFCDRLGINLDEGVTPKLIMTIISVGLACIFMVVGLVLGILMFIKYRRNRNRQPWDDEASKVWQGLAKDFKKARMERMASETPTEFVDRIRHIVREQRREGAMVGEELPNALSDFFVNYEAVHFGNKEGLGMLKEQAVELRKLVKTSHGNDKSAGKKGGGGGGGTPVGAASGGPKMSAKQQRQAEAASQAVRGKRS